jgi:spore coat protein CotH
MDEDNPNHIVIAGDSWNDPVLFKEIPTDFSDWELEVGQENEETLQKVQRLIAFVRDSSDWEFKKNFEQYLNLDATLNYYVMMDYCWMYDNTGKNMLLATYDGNVWYPTLYDLDTTWGTTYNGKGLTEYEDELLSVSNNRLWKRFGELYKKEIAERYFELRATLLDTEYVMAKFNEFHNSIPEELLTYETEKWDKEEAPIPGYPLSQIQEYLDSVIPRLDAKYTEWK